MIFVCEPTCRQMEHEKVNSGFIWALSAAFPKEAIRLYADKSHIQALKQTFARDQAEIEGLECSPIRLPGTPGYLAAFAYYRLFSRMLREARARQVGEVFFLSFGPEALFAIKLLKRKKTNKHFKFCFVLHGNFEMLANDTPAASAIVLPRKSLPARSLMRKMNKGRIKDLPARIAGRVSASVMGLAPVGVVLGKKVFDLRKIMELRHSSDYRYVSLAEHATRNAAKYIDTKRFDIFTVCMPIRFVAPRQDPKNEFVKFAVLGNVDSLVLHNIAHYLSQRDTKARYEIRVISKNHFGVEGIPSVVCVGKWGAKLDRAEMEAQAADIDFLLILCDETQYRLTCSGVIYEALSLIKPIVQFDNECINQFNTAEAPIGFRCKSFEEYIDRLEDIVERYESYRGHMSAFREGLARQRKAFAIEKAVPAVKQCFEW